MPTTPLKGYSVPTTGSEVGTWGDDINVNSFGAIDTNMAGVLSKTVAGSNITLSSSEAMNCIIRLTGAQSADIQLSNPNNGFYFVENLTTNSFNITVTNGVAGAIIPKGRSTIIADTTNGCRVAGTDSLPTGTSMLFKQTAAPTGWTKQTADNDKAIRVVSGSVTSGGSVAFSTAFATPATVTTVAPTTLTVSQIPSHHHFVATSTSSGPSNPGLASNNYLGTQGVGSGSTLAYLLVGSPNEANLGLTSDTGGGQSHTHSASGTATINVAYVDVIVAVKN